MSSPRVNVLAPIRINKAPITQKTKPTPQTAAGVKKNKPAIWPIIRKITGSTSKPAACWADIKVLALDETSTVAPKPASETPGPTKNTSGHQLGSGKNLSLI